MKKKFAQSFLLVSLLIITGCSTYKFINTDVKKNGKIAVIIADPRYPKVNSELAKHLSLQFNKKTTLKVVDQQIIQSVIKDYPERIIGPFYVIGNEVEPDISRYDMNTLAGYAKKLDVDYLYVFWVPGAMESRFIRTHYGIAHETKGPTHYDFVGEMVEFPSRKVIAVGYTTLMYIEGAIVLGPGSLATTSEEMAEQFSETTVDELVSKTGIGK